MNKPLLIYLLLLLNSSGVFAQKLPREMHFSADEKRLITGNLPYTGFYELFTIHDVYIDFDDPDYWDDLEDKYDDGDNENEMATLTINGIVYDSVGVRFKGNSSYNNSNDEKKSFNISLDAYKPGQELEGYSTLNLNNCMGDASYLAEVLFEHQISKHIPSLKGNFVHLFINGMDWGLYANVQQLNRDFLKEWFLDNEGALWRGEQDPNSNVDDGHTGDSLHSLYYLGNDTNTYKDYYHLKMSRVSNPFLKLKTLTRVMDTVSQTHMESVLGNYLDIDRTLWFLASENAFGDDDGYVVEGRSDYYFYYEPETGRFVPLEFDGNGAMDIDYVSQDIFLNSGKPNYTLQYKLLNHPKLRQRYLAHMRTLVNDELNVPQVHALINSLFSIINPIVQNDPVANYSYSEFLDGIDELKEFVTDREDDIKDESEIDEDIPEISDTEFYAGGVAWQRPVANQQVQVTTYATSPDDIDNVRLYYATGIVGKFTPVTMRDDGQHNDQQAGDGIYGATLPGQPGGTWVRFYIEAISDNSNETVAYDPPGAEHDVYVYLVQPERALDTSIVINEIMARNVSAVSDGSGEYNDWIELYNNSSQPKNIGGYYLTDNSLNLVKWQIPPGTTIPANGYMMFWADDNPSAGILHTNFKFSGDGEQLLLLNSNNELVDEISFGPQTDDWSYARVPNGTGSFYVQQHTFSTNNNPNPLAAFSISTSTSGCSPLPVSFINNSTGALSYLWDFGDGNTSTVFAASHVYTTAGIYTVTLTAFNAVFSHVYFQSSVIHIDGATPFQFNSDTLSTNSVVYQLNTNPGYLSYFWTTNQTTQSITVGATGNYCVTLTSANNCTVSDCVYVIVDALGIEEPIVNDNLFPNPADEFVIFETRIGKNYALQIFDAIGRVVYKNALSGNLRIDTALWPEGMYIIRIDTISKVLLVKH